MLRRGLSLTVPCVGVRTIVGVAPVLHFSGAVAPKATKEEQVKKNTAIALGMIKKFKGPVPAPYTRKYTQTFEQIEKDVEALLGGAEKMRKKVTDDQPMDKLSVMERCLRHAVWSYLKEEGKAKFNHQQMEKWLVYTSTDDMKLTALKRDVELKEKYAAFKAKSTSMTVPTFDWKAEYNTVVDREIVAEKRTRYDVLAQNTTERDEAAIEALAEQYRRPAQLKKLDAMVELLESFKPILAREAIMQRLTIKHLEGQLGMWRYLDWNPEIRDRAELEADNYATQWWMEFEEKRLANIRLRSKNEVKEVMEKSQAAKAAASPASSSVATKSASGEQAAREKLIQEIIRLQARLGKKDEEEGEKKPAAAGHGHGGH